MEDQKARCGNHQSVENPGMSCIIQRPQSLIAFFFLPYRIRVFTQHRLKLWVTMVENNGSQFVHFWTAIQNVLRFCGEGLYSKCLKNVSLKMFQKCLRMMILRFSTSDWNFFILWCGDFSLKVGGGALIYWQNFYYKWRLAMGVIPHKIEERERQNSFIIQFHRRQSRS